MYVVGEMLFESLISLVNYYTRNPLYRNVKLAYPISKDVLKTMTKKYGNGILVSIQQFPLNNEKLDESSILDLLRLSPQTEC